MRTRAAFTVPLLIVASLVASGCCNLLNRGGPSQNAIQIQVTANTALAPWLEQAISDFNGTRIKIDKRPIYVNAHFTESGQAVTDIISGKDLPDVWIPDDAVWSDVLAGQGQASFQGSCVSVAKSPLVIAMWRPIAESLGWPGRSLGWLDIGSLAADPSAWAYYSGGQFGATLRMGHTHPGLSGTGASTLLAIVHAAESKTDAVTVDDINQPIVQASVGAFESTVSWFSTSTDSLGQTMQERGVKHLGAAVMYESTAVHYGSQEPGIVPIYPFEGTFVATHPACINTSTGTQAQQAATLFRDYLLEQEAQQLALANGLRPVNESISVGVPLDPAHGVDLRQPKRVFRGPTVDAVYAVQDLWQAARKDVNLVMLIDTSGSMRGTKMESVRQAATEFVEQMGDDDFITIIAFSKDPNVLVEHEQVGMSRDMAISTIKALQAEGNTALYDAVGIGTEVIADVTSSQASNVMVVLTDGKDTASYRYRFDDRLIEAAIANDSIVFTIAYGTDAEQKLLSDLAQRANGNYYLGTEANINEIYQEMSAAFGGTAGIGR
jgi:Ca-activated chloride channel family protein